MSARVAFLVVVLALVPSAAAVHDMQVYVDATSWFRAGLLGVGVGTVDDGDPVPPSGIGAISLDRRSFAVGQCHRELHLDLMYSPEGLDTPAGFLPYQFTLELFDAQGVELASWTVGLSGTQLVATVPAAGSYRTDLYLLTGAGDGQELKLNWTLRVRGFEALGEPTCMISVNEVEANPPGTDAGNEWAELLNKGFEDVDVSGWRLWTDDTPPEEHFFPEGSVVPGGQRLVVNLTSGQFIDNVGEVVVISDASGNEVDRTPALTDTANDNRTNQRSPELSELWAFLSGTPGSQNREA